MFGHDETSEYLYFSCLLHQFQIGRGLLQYLQFGFLPGFDQGIFVQILPNIFRFATGQQIHTPAMDMQIIEITGLND